MPDREEGFWVSGGHLGPWVREGVGTLVCGFCPPWALGVLKRFN